MLLISDLHLELWQDFGESLIKEFPQDDLLFIAGDLCNANQLPVIIPWLCEKYRDVIAVLGNHEHYYHTPKQVNTYLKKIKNKNFHLLENSIIAVQNYKIAGCTLWFNDDPLNENYQNSIGDFKFIKDFTPWVYNTNKASQIFINSLSDVDIIVTHHCPSSLTVTETYKTSDLNRFFVCDMTKAILKIKPKFWFFGHNHCSFDFNIGSTRLISNPRGYPHFDLNSQFTLNPLSFGH